MSSILTCVLIVHHFTSVPDSPHEPDPEPYEPMPPRLIPLDEVSAPLTHSHSPEMQTSQLKFSL